MSAEAEQDYEPLTVKEAIALLSSLQPSQVIAALRHNDYVMLGALAFQGFRMDAGGYANPIVRRRLAEEAAKNPGFAEKLRELAKEPSPAAQPPPPARTAAPLPPKAEAMQDSEKYRAERDRLKHERDAAIAAKTAADRLLVEAKRELIATKAGKAETEQEFERLKQRIERMERKQRQLETANAALRRASIQPTPPTSPRTPDQPPAAPIAPEQKPFAEAVRHLLVKDRENVALSLVNDVLRATPDDVDALEIKADALVKAEKTRDAVPVLRSLVTIHVQHDALFRAAAALYKLMMVTPNRDLDTKLVRDFYSALGRSNGSYGTLAEPLTSLRIDNPDAYIFIKTLAPRPILQAVFPEQKFYSPDAALPLVLPGSIAVTARKLIAAIDRNDLTVVELSQQALRGKAGDERSKILGSITSAADGDASYAKVLAPAFSRGPIVVDSSNVAWHGQEMVAHQQPRIEFVLAIRRVLREKGYFPVVMMADANFPFVVNDQYTARKMIGDEQIQLVIGGSDADEHILREAHRLSSPILTNDYMTDWDPEQKTVKIQYSFTPDGRPSIYF